MVYDHRLPYSPVGYQNQVDFARDVVSVKLETAFLYTPQPDVERLYPSD
jgi:hypothetical protein